MLSGVAVSPAEQQQQVQSEQNPFIPWLPEILVQSADSVWFVPVQQQMVPTQVYHWIELQEVEAGVEVGGIPSMQVEDSEEWDHPSHSVIGLPVCTSGVRWVWRLQKSEQSCEG